MIGARRLAYAARGGLRSVRSGDFGVALATVQDGVDAAAFERLAATMRADPVGQRLLIERPRVGSATVDLPRLRALPTDTMGRRFVTHLEDNGLLRDVPLIPSPFPLPEEAEYAKARWRETHDFRHVLLGLGVSIRDEIVLQAFQLGQYWNWFAVCQMSVGPLLAPWSCAPIGLVRDYLRAYRAGRAAPALINLDWEDWLARPVDDLRAHLGVTPLGRR